ncbi:MAG TPA: hypothetical protein VH682_07185, partial [Gemmataceae bacterium]
MFRKLFASRHRRPLSRPFRKLMLEALEDRLAPAGFSLTDVGMPNLNPGTTNFQPVAINNSGQIIGDAVTINLSTLSAEFDTFLYSNGQWNQLTAPSGFSHVAAEAINNSGQIFALATSDDVNYSPFLYSNGQWTNLGLPAGVLSLDPVVGGGLDDAGDVVASDDTSVYEYSPVNGQWTNLSTQSAGTGNSWDSNSPPCFAINGSGQVVIAGVLNKGGSPVPDVEFLASNGTWTDLGAPSSSVSAFDPAGTGINNTGDIVVTAQGIGDHPFLYSNSTKSWTDLGTPSGVSSITPTGLDGAGDVLAYSGSNKPFLYSNGQWTNVNDVLPSGTTITLTGSGAIFSDNGQIVDQGSDGNYYLLTPQQSTTTTISNASVSPNALTVSNNGQQVMVSATVTTNGSPATAGNVVFSLVGANGTTVASDGPTGVVIGSNSQASDTLTVPGGTAAGSYTLQIAYTNNNQTTTQTIAAALNINAIPVNVALSGVTPTQLTASGNAQAVTATASVTPASGSVNEGTVTFTLLSGITPVGQSVQVQVVNGMAQLTSSNPLIVPANTPAGSYT